MGSYVSPAEDRKDPSLLQKHQENRPSAGCAKHTDRHLQLWSASLLQQAPLIEHSLGQNEDQLWRSLSLLCARP